MNAIDPISQRLPAARSEAGGVRLEAATARHGGGVAALHGVDLAVERGEFVALVGPSGAGKTTLLRAVAGLHPLASGRVAIGGRDVTAMPARARNIGFVFQNYALFGHMSVAENVAFGLRVRPRATRPGRAAIAARVAELLELVQVAPFSRRRPAELSGGQRQRVALARALATDPALLLLDEPFGALDPLVRKEIRTWLRGLHDRLGLTSILVTHDQAEAIEVADRIVVLDRGAIAQAGTPAELERHPASDFIHRFLGERVLFEGTAEAGLVRLDDAPDTRIPAHGAHGRVRLSLRPWEIGIAPPGAGVAAQLVSRRPAGPHDRASLVLAGSLRPIELLLPPDLELAPGALVSLELGRAKVFTGPF